MSKKILGLDLGSNSIGWALLEEKDGRPVGIIGIGCRIFNKAVEERVPTPKNQKRREMRLGRRVLQRRARRKKRMLNYLVSLGLLPRELQSNTEPEKLLNQIGDPYKLRVKALDQRLSPHELGRILLHFAARRGFLSNKKQIAGDLVDDPDTVDYLEELENSAKSQSNMDKVEGEFKKDISKVRQDIEKEGARTLGEYLHRSKNRVKRNRVHEGGHLRTDRAMYQDELEKIWEKQCAYFNDLPDDFMEDSKGVKRIIFYQRPLKLRKDRVGKCSLEKKHHRANMARLEAQKFRYLQDINHLKYVEPHSGGETVLNKEQRVKLACYLEHHPKITVAALKKELNLDKRTKINLDEKNLKGNITACDIRSVIGDQWDDMNDNKQKSLFEDLFTIKKKSALKKRLMGHWRYDGQTAIRLCLLEFEPSHSNHSLKAIKKLLPYLEEGMIYSDARQAAGYAYVPNESQIQDKLPEPPETANPIVNKGLHELRRVVNAIIKEYGKPDIIRIEMARDLEMNTKRYKEHISQQEKNKKANEEAQEEFKRLNLGQYASRDEKIKYRLWRDQKECCAYSNQHISLAQVFSAETETDHILPFKKSLDDSYMNKVICLAAENREKRDRTPVDAWEGGKEKWNQITQSIARWDKSLKSKVARFYQTESDLEKRDFIASQLNDTRYISRLAQDYMRQLGCDVSVTKGIIVSKIRHQWGFNTLIGETDEKDRADHRHHAIDAVAIAATSRSLYKKAVAQMQQNKLKIEPPYPRIREELGEKINNMIISHDPQRKLSDSLHEETGAGYIAKHGGLVYRKALNPQFTEKKVNKIVDNTIKEIVLEHIKNYKNTKEAFADGVTVYHKDGKTPIKRVRILQSKTNEKKLVKAKFGVKDKQGKVFKWMSYGNIHHVEIVRHRKTGETKGEFVTMMLATHRARGINMPKQPIVKTNHGEDYEFQMALHINDTVSIEVEDGKRVFYRIQKLDSGAHRILLRLSTATTIERKNEEIYISINKESFSKNKITLHHVNSIGRLMND